MFLKSENSIAHRIEGDSQMKKFRLMLHTLVIATVTCAFASVAQAQATRTWVSGVGDDVNPCSRTAPCKTFAGAISKTAARGEINVLDSAGYGAVTITKSITIDGGGALAGLLASGGNAIVVNAATTDVVTLRNLDINGLGLATNGINILAAKSVYIEHSQIYGFTNDAILDNRTASQTPAAALFVNDVAIHTNGNGIAVTGTSASGTIAFIERSRIQQNTGFGIAGSHSNDLHILHTLITYNGAEGFKIDTGAGATVIGSIINGNLTGVVNNGSGLSLADTTIADNGTGVSGAVTSFGNNNVRGNAGGNTLPAPVGQQ
jgi:hypothetical protein